MPPRLIINADDFGLTRGINRAIIELHRAGVISSASLMATGPAFDDAVALARANPTLGVGCHLVFVDGIPLSHPESIPTLLGADDKCFRPSFYDFAQAALRRTIEPLDLARETAAQIQRLQRAGIDVTHVDTHKHTHAIPAIAETVLHIANRCGIQPLRNPFEPSWSVAVSGAGLSRRLQMRLLRRLAPVFHRLTLEACNRGFILHGTLGIAATGILNRESLRATLLELVTNHPNATYELCCHPGYDDADLDQQKTRLRDSREQEYRALREVVPEILSLPNAPELIHYGNLGIPGLQRASGQFTANSGHEAVV